MTARAGLGVSRDRSCPLARAATVPYTVMGGHALGSRGFSTGAKLVVLRSRATKNLAGWCQEARFFASLSMTAADAAVLGCGLRPRGGGLCNSTAKPGSRSSPRLTVPPAAPAKKQACTHRHSPPTTGLPKRDRRGLADAEASPGCGYLYLRCRRGRAGCVQPRSPTLSRAQPRSYVSSLSLLADGRSMM
jgi:hypothetical protein